MKLKYIILTIGLIVLAHLIILFVCFYQPDDSKTSNVPEKLESPKNVVKNDGSATVQPANPASGVAAVQPVSESRNRQYPPFNFQTAWKGVIPDLPASAGTRAGILVDADTGNVLWDKQASTPVQIASMTKLMTLLLACEDIQAGRNGITLQSPVKVSSAAMKIGGSQVWLDPKETFPLEELLKAVAIKSANDAAYQVAEFLGQGDVYGFVGRMNRRAREIGMKNTHFHNPHGLPGKTSAE
ncbi:MAG: D-alanyl-D-alanine carboxypeptidase, partial [Lentisphaerae bacterium]|nr:D-alanyl-D-alanine carboxypeptidase [Lentisphaerota bacterium]